MKLFVYGTLKRGHGRERHLAGQRFLGTARTVPRYRLYDCGAYPALVETGDGLAVEGELWEVDPPTVGRLDEVEGVQAGLFQRRPVQLQPPHERTEAVAYFYRPSVAGMNECPPRW